MYQARKKIRRIDEVRGGHGPFRGLDAPFALMTTVVRGGGESQTEIYNTPASRRMPSRISRSLRRAYPSMKPGRMAPDGSG